MLIRTIKYEDGCKQHNVRSKPRGPLYARLYTYPNRNPLLIPMHAGGWREEISRTDAAHLLQWWRAQERAE